MVADIDLKTVNILLLITVGVCGCACKHGRSNYRSASATAIGVLNSQFVRALGQQVFLSFRCNFYFYHCSSPLYDWDMHRSAEGNNFLTSTILHKMFAVNKNLSGYLPNRFFGFQPLLADNINGTSWKKKEKATPKANLPV